MSQTETAPLRGVIISELACVSAELADMQVRNAEIATRVSRIIRDLSCPIAPVPPGADLLQLRERLGAVRGRLEATAEIIKNSAERMPQAAPAGEKVASAAAAATAAADVPRVPRREPEVRSAGGGLVQDGGSLPKPDAAAPAGAPLVRDLILDAYAKTSDSLEQIAKDAGSTRNSVHVTLNKARHRNDPRVKAGDDARAARTTPTLAPVSQPAPRDIADSAKPVASTPAPAVSVGRVEIPAGKLIAIRGAEVHGPFDVWRTSKETAKAFGFIADGQLYGLEIMARHGGLDPKVCINLIPMWAAALAKIGIELHHHKGFGVRIRAIGGQA